LAELCPEAPPAFQDLLMHCLRPNPAERPASAIEVYLRLQDLGKASGILLLPPGALEKLSAARKAAEPTVEYVPGGARWRRWLWVGLAAVVVLAAGAAGVAALLKH
jgi:hypothetical protein